MPNETASISRGAYWTGIVLSTLVVVFLLFDGAIKLVPLQVVIDTMQGLGYPPEHARTIGVITLAATVLYAIPRSSILGAVLLTGLLGGAIATNLRAGTPIFSHLLFGVYLGVLMWGGLYLRDVRVRAILPLLR
ncbi:DoxX family protein [Labrys neptuniae]|uniref:DoxX family protein n=1 Tax=Labrys neptuniae TaxID=376174 RepID=UPI00289282EC|nr:DoxX family protein [Labrys neptuniae]MDT3382249.1 DoxX family protein [Labrys neptuniae]